MINMKEKKEAEKKLYVSDEELDVDYIYIKVQEYLTAHVYCINEYKDVRHSNAYRAEMYNKFLINRANARHAIEQSGLTDDEKLVMEAYYLGDNYCNYRMCAQRTGYTEKEVARLHAKGFVKVANRLQRTGKVK